MTKVTAQTNQHLAEAPIHIVGIGLDGSAGLSLGTQQLIETATLLVGSSRHLSCFTDHRSDRLLLDDLTLAIAQIRQYLIHPPVTMPIVVVLASGDPLLFGLGRLLLAEFPAEQLSFHPHLSSIQLAFSRIRQPWQAARLISAHGRSLDELIQALQQGAETIAVLTDGVNTPAAIAQLWQALDLPTRYRLWVCENLGGDDERVIAIDDLSDLQHQTFAPLNVLVLQRTELAQALNLAELPLFGVPDACFLSFRDRPGLMTKCEVRVQVLAAMALQPNQVVWDIGAGTGSVAVEIARLCPTSQIYAIEKIAIGYSLIQQNCQRFQVANVVAVHGEAPDALPNLPTPDRIFIGGSSGRLIEILEFCCQQIAPTGKLVLAIATLEHLAIAINWLQTSALAGWSDRLLQIEVARSVSIGRLTRLAPLNPVNLLLLERKHSSQ